MKKKDILKIARRVLKLPDSKDKVICFIPQWEQLGIRQSSIVLNARPFIINQRKIFSSARFSLLTFKEFSWLVYQDPRKEKEFPKESPYWLEYTIKTMELDSIAKTIKNALFKSKKKQREIDKELEIMRKEDKIEVVENKASEKEYLEKECGIKRIFELNVLCVDYQYFSLNH